MNLQVDSSIGSIVLGLVLAGCGGAMFLPPNNSVVMGSVSRDRLGMVSAVIPVVRQMGFSLGITLIGTVYALREVFHRSRLQDLGLESFELSRIAVVAGYKDGFSVAVAFVAISIICSSSTWYCFPIEFNIFFVSSICSLFVCVVPDLSLIHI